MTAIFSSTAGLDIFRSDTCSAPEEGDLLAALFARLGVRNGYFCELGAREALYLSSTYALYDKKWRGCYIDADPQRSAALQRSIARPDVACINTVAEIPGAIAGRSLDSILSSIRAPLALDLVSIDIGGFDLAAWRSMVEHCPTVVAIKYNDSIPLGVRFENQHGSQGNSISTIQDHAHSIGYSLVAQTSSSLIYLIAKIAKQQIIPLVEPSIEVALFRGYDGALIELRRGKIRTPSRA